MVFGCFLATGAAALATSTDFVEPSSSPENVGLGPTWIVTADLDGDADLDLATANVSSGDVTILRNNGSANFTEPASSPEDAGSFPDAITAADLDGDGDQDLAVTNQESDDVTILRNNGSGNFSEPASSPEPAGDIPAAITAGDIDGDTDPDLVVANALTENNVTILRNNGSGNFTQPASSPEDAGNKPLSVAIADLDGDADRDLAVSNQQSSNVSILGNNGSGNFTELASSPENAGTFPQGVVAARLDGDLDRDLAVANQGTDDVTILRNIGAGDYEAAATSPEQVGDTPLRAPVVGDFDGDGRRDLAVSNSGTDNVSILANAGQLDFEQPATSPEDAGDGARGSAIGDLDGDGDLDLAISNHTAQTVTILRNRN